MTYFLYTMVYNPSTGSYYRRRHTFDEETHEEIDATVLNVPVGLGGDDG